MKAWHFAANDRRLRFGDNRLIRKGMTIKYKGAKPIAPGERGLHASKKLVDALGFAGGNIICRVEMSGDIIRTTNIVVATERKCLWWMDGTSLLWEFACWCTEQALPAWEAQYPEDKRPHRAIEARRGWLAGEVSDKELDEAHSAVWKIAGVMGSLWEVAFAAGRASSRDSVEWAAMEASAILQDVWPTKNAKEHQNRKLTALVMKAYRETQ